MASFFPPGLNDKGLLECRPGNFEVYCNSILPSDRRLARWYQAVNLTVGIAAIVVPTALFVLYQLVGLGIRIRTKAAVPTRGAQSVKPSVKHAHRLSGVGSSTPYTMSSFRSTKSFRVLPSISDGFSFMDMGPCDLVVLSQELSSDTDLSTAFDSKHSLASSFVSPAVPEQMTLGSIDTAALGNLENDTLAVTVASLVDMYTRFDWAGFAVRCSSMTVTTQLDRLLEALSERGISCIILCHHDCEILDSLSFAYASGIIIENACILENGERRGYFQARRIRDVMVRCARVRDQRADDGFFVGFLDRWRQRPHPSVVKRSIKIAEHFGAILQHGPLQITTLDGPEKPTSPYKTISGFEYLRRAEIVELQKSWTSGGRAVVVADNGDPSPASDIVSRLPLDDIEHLIFGATATFVGKEVSHAIRTLSEETQLVTPPAYPDTLSLPSEINFWDTERDGNSLSAKGCFPIWSEPLIAHYGAIVDSQAQLRELDMLQAIVGAEEQSILAALQALAHHKDCDVCVHDLIRGLRTRGVRAYKGLHTGFRMPEGNAQFWGVCKIRDESDPGGIDIFVSQKSPNDAAVILHTWLAHHDKDRLEKFEHEVILENVTGLGHVTGLPSTIRTALDTATPAEVLLLLQKLRLSQSNHRLADAIGTYATSILIEGTTQSHWRSLCARTCLDGTQSTEDLLRLRLEHHARRGAKRLPALEDLVFFHDRMEEAMVDALYNGCHTILSMFTRPLIHCYGRTPAPGANPQGVDVAADLFALIFFTILRRAAFEDVYLETTDRCPLFVSHPDQAAVFAELWTLGSQCESYFGLVPQDIGKIIYHRYNKSLETLGAPTVHDRETNEIMTMYATVDAVPEPSRQAVLKTLAASSSTHLAPGACVHVWKMRFAAASAMSIFCLPAVADIVLLTFVGRGLFMTGFMDPQHVQVSGYAILASLLLTAGVTGWVGSGASFYLPHYAYDNMVHFHVQRLSGGFVIAALVSTLGFVGFTVKMSVACGLVFAAYMLGVSTYLNLLGVMSTMHQQGSPLPSGRIVFLQSFCLLLLSPLLSTFVNGYDLAIYLSVLYAFLVLSLYRYRRLCHRWSNWMSNIPGVYAADILSWHASEMSRTSSGDHCDASCHAEQQESDQCLQSQNAFRAAVAAYDRSSHRRSFFTAPRAGLLNDGLVAKVAEALPYIDWLLERGGGGYNIPQVFSPAWFTKVGDAIHQQRQLSRGLKDHNVFVLFRHAKYDIGQNVGLFLVALLDRWIMLVMSARKPYPSIYVDLRSRYGFCFCLGYFCLASIILDTTLYKYWALRDTLSEEKLRHLDDAKRVASHMEKERRKALGTALIDVFSKILIVFGVMTILLWLFIDNKETTIMYYGYSFGYSCVILFQFNRCFTTNVAVHIKIILCSAAIGFVGGCVIHALPWTVGFLYTDLLAQNFAGALAAIGTTLWCYKDWCASPSVLSSSPSSGTQMPTDPTLHIQRKVLVDHTVVDTPQHKSNLPTTFTVPNVISWDGTNTSNFVTELLCLSRQEDLPGTGSGWPTQVADTTLRMWASGRVKATVLSRQHFTEAGFMDAASLSFKNDEATLHIAVCFAGQTLIGVTPHPSPTIQLAHAIAEALLYHVAHVQIGLSKEQAVYAEHLIPGNECISKRIEAEFCCTEPDSNVLAISSRRLWMEFTKQLCLGIDINIQWDNLPQSVREVIVSRINGRSIWISKEFLAWTSEARVDLETVDFHARLALELHQRGVNQRTSTVNCNSCPRSVYGAPALLKPGTITRRRWPLGIFHRIGHAVVRVPVLAIKWTAIITGGSSNVERELFYLLDGLYLRRPLLYVIMLVWKVCWIIRNFWIHCLIISHRPSIAHITRLASKGAKRKIHKNRIVVELKRASITGFAALDDHNAMVLQVYSGTPLTLPDKVEPLFVATYDSDCRLTRRVEAGGRTSTYKYGPLRSSRQPISREVVHEGFQSVGSYDKYGRMVQGSLTIDNVALGFHYHYKSNSKGSSNVLRADYQAADTGDTLSVFWGKPVDIEDYTWVPSQNVGLIIRRIAGRTCMTTYDWSHRRDPMVTTFLEHGNGQRTVLANAPTLLANEAPLLDWPTNQAFDMDNLLVYHSPLHIHQMRRYANVDKVPGFLNILRPSGWVARLNRCIYNEVPTSRIRTELWSRWLKGGLDAVTACFVDEIILREEPLLRGYWRARDSGRLDDAVRALDGNISQIVAAMDIESDVSEVTLLAIRTSDLYAMGLSTDANTVTTRPQDCYNDTHDRVSIIFNDVGCWPNSPGGVSNCRRDLVNGHSTIRNHVLAECANEYGIPQFQVEKGVQTVKLLPLWGIDGGTAQHGLLNNLLQSQVDEKIDDTELQRDIVGTFIPLLNQFVKGCRTKRYTYDDLGSLSKVFLSMADYYEHKDYMRTWRSQEVEHAWVSAWLKPYEDPNIADPAHCFDIARPSSLDFRQSLYIYLAYFFIFAVGVPERCPRVFQSTHHGISSLFGMVLKYRRGVTFGIWDHAILWRECCLNFSVAQSELPVAVQSMLLSGIGLATHLAYFHADVILPCATVFNPMWEVELGTDGSNVDHRNHFRRKIDPVVNGISNMDAYKPVDKVRTDIPTVVMLSNIQFIKGIKLAIQAADNIVNQFGFKDYRLVIYGAKDRQPAYALQMEKLIVEKNLAAHVTLAGFGNSKEVLKDAWLFINSSISEGLPLAIGEAALAGVPIVATEVGATALVLTDPEDHTQRYGEVVPPNDPMALARAQISMLSMVGTWAKFTTAPQAGCSSAASPVLPQDITPEDVKWLTERFYECSTDRRRLGLLSREVVLRSFHGSRYIREHEQMYWIQWQLAQRRADRTLAPLPFKFSCAEPLRYKECDTSI